jgi:ABC-2 type transport system permease protein
MNTNIYRFELRMRLRSVIIWSLAGAAVMLTYMAFFPSFSQEAALVDEVMANFPPQFLEAFGMGGVSLADVMGFFSFVFLFAQLLLAVQASIYGFGLVSVEEAEWTADFLLTRPVTRTQILTNKLLAAATALLITDVVVWGAAILALSLFNGGQTVDQHTLFLMLTSLPIFQLFFLAVGLVISLLVKRVRSVTPYALGLAFGMYLLGAFSSMAGDVKLEWITPFKHFDGNYIVLHGAYNLPLVMISIAVILVALVGSYWRYLHRDIAAVA